MQAKFSLKKRKKRFNKRRKVMTKSMNDDLPSSKN